jgi:hypothetical protein
MSKQRFVGTKEIPREDIVIRPSLFQNRDEKYSKESVEKIVREGFDKSREPIEVWYDADSAKYVVISGHSRWEASKRLFEAGDTSLAEMPVKVFNGTLDEAIAYATLESNRLSTSEGLKGDVRAFKKAISGSCNKDCLRGIFKKDSVIAKLQDLQYLNEKGDFLNALASDQYAQYPNLENYARWTGELRRFYTQITDKHENEIFQYLYLNNNRKGLERKEDFKKLIEKTVGSFAFDPKKPLNLANFRNKSVYEMNADQQISEIEREIKDLESRNNYLDSLIAGFEKKKDTKNVEKYKAEYNRNNDIIRSKKLSVGKIQDAAKTANKGNLDLFGGGEEEKAPIKVEEVKKETPKILGIPAKDWKQGERYKLTSQGGEMLANGILKEDLLKIYDAFDGVVEISDIDFEYFNPKVLKKYPELDNSKSSKNELSFADLRKANKVELWISTVLDGIFEGNYTPSEASNSIAGDANKEFRQKIYSALIGKKATATESGVTNIKKELERRLDMHKRGSKTVLQEEVQKQKATEAKPEKEAWEMTFEEFSKKTQAYEYKSKYDRKYQRILIALKNNENFNYLKNNVSTKQIEKLKDIDTLSKYSIFDFTASRNFSTISNVKKIAHKDLIQKALSEGKQVPKEVLDEYPDLKKETPKAPEKPKDTKQEKEAWQMTFEEYKDNNKEFGLNWKNERATKIMFLNSKMAKLYEKEIDADNFGTGIRRKYLEDIRQCALENLASKKDKFPHKLAYCDKKLKEWAQKAIAEGKTVPKEVLDEYPDLKKETPKTTEAKPETPKAIQINNQKDLDALDELGLTMDDIKQPSKAQEAQDKAKQIKIAKAKAKAKARQREIEILKLKSLKKAKI